MTNTNIFETRIDNCAENECRDLMKEAFEALDPRNKPQYSHANCEMFWWLWRQDYSSDLEAGARALFYANKIIKEPGVSDARKSRFYALKQKWIIQHLDFLYRADIARIEIDEEDGSEETLYLLYFDIEGRIYRFHSYVKPDIEINNEHKAQNLKSYKNQIHKELSNSAMEQTGLPYEQDGISRQHEKFLRAHPEPYGAPLSEYERERLPIHEDAVEMALEHYVVEKKGGS